MRTFPVAKYVLRLGVLSPGAFGFALLCVAVATLLRQFFGLFGATLYFATYFPAILIIGLFAGIYAVFFAVVITTLIVWWAFVPPLFAFGHLSSTDLINFALFWVSAGLMTWVTDLYRRSVIELIENEAARKLLMNELNHRLGNTFATIQAIVNGTVADRETGQKLLDRFNALSRANHLVSSTSVGATSIDRILHNEIEAYATPERLSMNGPRLDLSGETARSISLIIHELTTNAAKYGSLSKPGGLLEVHWAKDDAFCVLRWREIDGPPVVDPTKTGFGSKLIRASLTAIDGTIEPAYHPDGYACELRFRMVPSFEQSGVERR